jgi:hypothetical protein
LSTRCWWICARLAGSARPDRSFEAALAAGLVGRRHRAYPGCQRAARRAPRFGAACRACPLAAQRTTAKEGRTITIGPHEARLSAARPGGLATGQPGPKSSARSAT